jgi:hypothetical protein
LITNLFHERSEFPKEPVDLITQQDTVQYILSSLRSSRTDTRNQSLSKEQNSKSATFFSMTKTKLQIGNTATPVTKRRKNQYVNNKDLYIAMVQYKKDYNKAKQINQRPEISNYIGECLLTIANRFASKPSFSGYSFKEEMIADGYENCIMYMHNFDPQKYNNPFAYFTQIIKFSFIRRIQREKKQQYVKLKNVDDFFTFQEVYNDQNDRFDRQMYENNQQFIKEYEDNLNERKAKNKKAPKK